MAVVTGRLVSAALATGSERSGTATVRRPMGGMMDGWMTPRLRLGWSCR